MGLFNFFKRNRRTVNGLELPDLIGQNVDQEVRSVANGPLAIESDSWSERDFEFLITGDIDVFADFDNIMTPNTLDWTKVYSNGCYVYRVGQDQFTYSIEPPGIQMIFNKEIVFSKAKKIADEIIQNIKATGQNAELVILDNTEIYRFD